MKIGFDAKRAFHNHTGLGNYSRTLISGLAQYYPQHEYFLFTPKAGNVFETDVFNQVHEVLPVDFISKTFSSLWRSTWMKKDFKRIGIQLYHGLSNELPFGIDRSPIASVVTIHDLIFERYPAQYNKIDIITYRKKFRYACAHAGRIIAISEQTKKDLVELYKIRESKIDICYQSCDPVFANDWSKDEVEKVKKKYNLPAPYFLYVGSVIERKNLLAICQSLAIIKNKIHIPLVVIGNGKSYKSKVKNFIQDHNLQKDVIFLSEKDSFVKANKKDMALVYAGAAAMIYPSLYEGFGLPVLEALWSRIPVITSNTSCLPETGGDAAIYVNPQNIEEIALAMENVMTDQSLREQMVSKGLIHAQKFTLDKCTASVMRVYKNMVK
jgi:glycosyltransferase involved in cell wall biosynthesis